MLYHEFKTYGQIYSIDKDTLESATNLAVIMVTISNVMFSNFLSNLVFVTLFRYNSIILLNKSIKVFSSDSKVFLTLRNDIYDDKMERIIIRTSTLYLQSSMVLKK